MPIAKGDTVVHAGKPEWGPGDVLSVEGMMHEGKPVQRVTVRFARGGLKTLSTAFADLKPAPARAAATRVAPSAPVPMSGGAVRPAPSPMSVAAIQPDPDFAIDTTAEALQKLPEAATDPFLPTSARLKATLAIYRYTESPAGLIDWAVTQTAMRDPLAKYSRHDLEVAFERFRISVDNHLRKLLPQARKEAPKDVEAILAGATSGARHAVRRVDIGR
ncbi:MAG TPA: DUF3553 domain-containing protein [Phycisphaerales bacterium]|nr:DUF3553 domain-containing protein [Phycisphaerales bacterium]